MSVFLLRILPQDYEIKNQIAEAPVFMAVDKGRLVLALNHLLIVQLFNLPCKSSGTCLGCLAWATHKYFFSISVQMTRAIVSCWHAPWSNHMLKIMKPIRCHRQPPTGEAHSCGSTRVPPSGQFLNKLTQCEPASHLGMRLWLAPLGSCRFYWLRSLTLYSWWTLTIALWVHFQVHFPQLRIVISS